MSDSIEEQIQAKGLTAPRVTPADIESEITDEHYFTAADAADFARGAVNNVSVPGQLHPSLFLLTFCVLVLKNGFTVTGESACASPENFDAEIGQKIARENAIQKVWPLLGFRLRDKLASNSVEERARRAHEINRAYCAACGDASQLPWDQAPQWQKDSAIAGVTFALAGASPEELHQSWVDLKVRDGWVHGDVKDAEAKTHPCIVPYDQLPQEQRVKDYLFRAAVAL